MTLDDLIPADRRRWLDDAIRARFGTDAAVARVESRSARAARLFRLTIRHAAGDATCYLKEGDALAWADTDGGTCDLLGAVAGAFDGSGGLLAFPLLACDSPQRWTLVDEVRGETLSTIYRRALLSPAERRRFIQAAGGLGRWLSRLHGLRTRPLTETLAAETGAYVERRLRGWAAEDAACGALADRALRVTSTLVGQLASSDVRVSACHGDITAGNVLVCDGAVGLIDMDDLRVDLPAIDVSQALMEINEFTRISGAIPLRRYRARAEAAFRDGYGPLPTGAAFELPHLRNLSVAAITLAPRRREVLAIWTNRRYRRVVRGIAQLCDRLGA